MMPHTARPTLSSLLKAHGVRPNKRLGQHFLLDGNLCHRIVRAAGITPAHRIVEIGPGPGALTRALLETAGRVTAIEMDAGLLPVLDAWTAEVGTLTIIRADALKVDFQALADERGGPLTLVANLPYNISTPLMFHFLHQRRAFDSMTLMFQKEVAERLVAEPEHGKAYGAVSVLCRLWMESERILDVAPSLFYPPPKVESTVARFIMRKNPLHDVGDEEFFSRLVHAAFNPRRKTLSNTLKPLSEARLDWLDKAGIDSKRRGETLSLAEFARLSCIAQQNGSRSPGCTGKSFT